MDKRVTTIPAALDPLTRAPIGQARRKRVAAYARVSTDSDEQLVSFETQKSYFREYIARNPDWDIVKVYADEGISGTSTKRRKSFQEMVEMVRRGEIDLVLAKSVSRFGRNVLDTVALTREFRALGVDVFFEEDNLHTIDPASEFTLSIYASIAQEESRHISENVKWTLRHKFSKGEVSIPFGSFLGYRKGSDGAIEIDESEAPTVREIYRLFLREGMTPGGIAKRLMELGRTTATGNPKWTHVGVLSILTNEKYKGEAILQKRFVADYLDHRVVRNDGQLAKYHVRNSHPAIIDPEEWDMVQLEVARRNSLGKSYSSADPFGCRLYCADCGGLYGRKVWHSNDRYARSVFQCNSKFGKGCGTPHLYEEEIKEKFLTAYAQAVGGGEALAADMDSLIELLTDTKAEEERMIVIASELAGIENSMKKLIEDKKALKVLPADFAKKEGVLRARFDEVSKESDALKEAIETKRLKRSKMVAFKREAAKAPGGMPVWSRELWIMSVESATVHRDKTVAFRFFNGVEVRV